MEKEYQLINVLLAHDGPVRCLSLGIASNEILTGCQSDAPNLRRWRLKEDSLEFEQIGSPIYHDHWVTAVNSRSPHHNIPSYPQVTISCFYNNCTAVHFTNL